LNPVLIEALEEAGKAIEKNIKDTTPRNTGRLAASIGHFDSSYIIKPNPKTNSKDAVFNINKGDNPSLEIGTKVEYAPFVHARNPFITRGFYNSQKEVERIFEMRLKDLLE
jgi:hypothetical protein